MADAAPTAGLKDAVVLTFNWNTLLHSRALIYPRLVRGSRAGRLRVKVIDTARSREDRGEIEQRFAGVEGCRFCFDGFSAQAVDVIEQA